MQDCFRQYPEIYGAELADDDEDGSPAPIDTADGDIPVEEDQAVLSASAREETGASTTTSKSSPSEARGQESKGAVKIAEDDIIPKEATDATEANNTETK